MSHAIINNPICLETFTTFALVYLRPSGDKIPLQATAAAEQGQISTNPTPSA